MLLTDPTSTYEKHALGWATAKLRISIYMSILFCAALFSSRRHRSRRYPETLPVPGSRRRHMLRCEC